MYNSIFFIIVSIIFITFIFSEILNYLNSSNRNKKIPRELEDIYDDDKYKKSQAYGKVNDKFSVILSSFSTGLILIMLFTGGFAYINNYVLSINENPIISALIFFGILMFASDILNTPFSVYAVFVIEEKFGFNKTTIKTFIIDKIKTLLIGAVIGGVLFVVIIWFYLQTRELFWIWAWVALSVFSIFITMFYSTLIVPLFNKQTALAEGELRNSIEEFCKKTDFKLDNIYVIDGSKRSTKANAYFSGLGTQKRIVLYDTLIEEMTVDEIIAVLAHEIGHYKKKHTLYNIMTSFVQTGIMFYIFSIFVDNPLLSKALGSEVVSFQLGLIAFGILYSPVSMILGLFMNMLSRKNEYEADNFAKQYGQAENLISGLKKLSKKNLSNLTPHPFYVSINYSHPTLYQRIKALKEDERNES